VRLPRPAPLLPHTGLIMAMGLNGLAADDQILALAKTVYGSVLTDGLVHPLPATAGA
jgi:hypothetical protein